MLQACRGKQYDAGIKMSADDGTGSSEVTLPVEADFLYVYSTADGLYVVTELIGTQHDCCGSTVWYDDLVVCKLFSTNGRPLSTEQGRLCFADVSFFRGSFVAFSVLNLIIFDQYTIN